MGLSDIGAIRRQMAEHGVSFKKKYGQNFLTNSDILSRIADEAAESEDFGIIEIGAGSGLLTRELCERYSHVVSLEIDEEMLPLIAENLTGYTNYTLIRADVMKTDLHELISEQFTSRGIEKIAVCANLPYYITTPVIMLLLESAIPLESVTVMIQKEVADRLTSSPGSSQYGAVTASVSYYGSAKRLFIVSAGNFLPAPKVDSAVIKIQLYKDPPVKPKNPEFMFRVIGAAFAQRRKTLSNALMSVFGNIGRESIDEAINACGLDKSVRGEKLSVAQFADLSDKIAEKINNM